MYNQRIERVEEAMRKLNSTLREQCVDTKLITIKQWNEEIAPKLSETAMAVESIKEGKNIHVTARSYRLPDNYFE